MAARASLGPDATEEQETERFKSCGMSIEYGPIHDRNINAVRKLLEIVLPVTYADGFYKDLLLVPEDLRLMVYVGGVFVGTAAARIEERPDGKRRVHILLLAVLAAYRGFGLGSSLLRRILRAARTRTGAEEIVEAYLHVQTSNVEAQSLYTRLSFEKCPEPVKDYYTRVEDRDSYILRRWLSDSEPAYSISPSNPE